MTASRDPAIGRWLLLCASIVLALVWLGGVTRLTNSGLSIVEWKPATGVLPPLSSAGWEEEFAKYRETPEFVVNSTMGLERFKEIYWIEYAHRQLARLLGVVFVVPAFYFWRSGRLGPRRTVVLAGVLVLGGAQAVMGWYMVQSGLVDVPRVSHLRLAAHLALAVVLFSVLLWQALGELGGARRHGPGAPPGPRWRLTSLTFATGATMVWGALMAGLKAGVLFPTFPMMNDAWLPPGVGGVEPLWLDVFENPTTVHFVHRLLATVTSVFVLACWWSLRGFVEPWPKWSRRFLLVVWAAQIGLGGLTVLRPVDIHYASLHQVNAVLLLGVVLGLLRWSLPSSWRRRRLESGLQLSGGGT